MEGSASMILLSRAAALALLLGAGEALAAAQPDDPPRPPDAPALTDPSVEQEQADLSTRRANPPTIMPSSEPTVRAPIPGQPDPREITPGIPGDALGVPVGRLYAEGSFLVRRVGAMLRAPSGEWIFVFAPSPTGEIDTPMVLAPSSELEAVLPIVAEQESPRPLMVTGQVLVYAGRNYLVPLAISDAAAFAQPPAEHPDGALEDQQPPPGAGESPTPSQPPTMQELAADPDVASLIADLEARRNVPRGLAPRTAAAAPGRESLLEPTAVETIQEGTILVRRRARMVRETTGAWTLVLDNDGGFEAAGMVILPCQNLAAMERLAAGQADEAQFEVTARVLTFQGRNYAMPLMFSLLRASDVRGLQ
ncbi:MAG: hypothetical protein KDA05_10030 [Phycisphaerales bacterium]|nr:hypothetical protein [Phycisphaerales bacterium]MCB9840159.1 hypothetical protein [Phycisphaeraceae bacterium]